MTKRKKYTAKFKAKVVLELIEGDNSISAVASKYNINPNILHRWRRQLFDNASVVFEQEKALKEAAKVQHEHEIEVDNLNRIIGEKTARCDYLRRSIDEVFERRSK